MRNLLGALPAEVDGIPVASTAFFAPPGKALVWRGPMKQKMIVQLLSRIAWPDLDVLVLDLPPGTSDEPLTVAELIKGKAAAILVTTPQRVSTEDVARSHGFAKSVGMPVLGVVENMAGLACECGRTHHLFGEGGGAALAEALDTPLLGSVPIEPAIVAAGDSGRPLVLSGEKSVAADALTAIAQRALETWPTLTPSTDDA